MQLRTRTAASALAAAAALLAAAPAPAAAQGFSTTNVELLWGRTFHDAKLGYDTVSGNMTTLTLNHFSTWEHGDSFAFFDLYGGDFRRTGFPGYPGANLYAEWHPRVFFNKLAGTKGDTLGIFRNWGLAGEVNWGPAFYAYLLGVGVDFAVPFPGNVSLNLYYRYDRFDYHVWQLSPYWNVPFGIGPVPFLFAGFVDIAGTKDAKGASAVDVMFQPQLLVDVLAPFGGKPNRLWLGCEWYLHSYPSGPWGEARTVSAPQAMVQWTIY